MGANVEKQVAMAADTWQVMQKNGVTGDTALLIDLFWLCADAAPAQAFALKLPQVGVYGIEAFADGNGWIIKGQSGPRAYTLETIQQLTREMAEFGERHGCDLDGWGALLPRKKPWWKFW